MFLLIYILILMPIMIASVVSPQKIGISFQLQSFSLGFQAYSLQPLRNFSNVLTFSSPVNIFPQSLDEGSIFWGFLGDILRVFVSWSRGKSPPTSLFHKPLGSLLYIILKNFWLLHFNKWRPPLRWSFSQPMKQTFMTTPSCLNW